MSENISLTYSEMLLAAHAGAMRHVENCKKGRQPYYGAGDENDWQLNIEGCLGEYALAKYLNVHWSGKGHFRAPDVGGVDVRTAREKHYRLILHQQDPDDRIFWLLCGKNGQYQIKGWITGKEGKKTEYWSDPADGRPAFFVPQDALYSPEQYQVVMV